MKYQVSLIVFLLLLDVGFFVFSFKTTPQLLELAKQKRLQAGAPVTR